MIPGVVYPEGFPPTTPELVRSWLANADPSIRSAVGGFFRRDRTGTEAAALLESFGNLAWDTRERSAKVYREWSLRDWMVSDFFENIRAWLPEWQIHLADHRTRWDRRYPAYRALATHLRTLPTVTREAALETQRQILSFVVLTKEMTDLLQRTASTLAATYDPSMEQNLELTKDAIRAAIGGMKKIVEAIAGGILGAIPWWGWALGIGVLALQTGLLGLGAAATRRAIDDRRRRLETQRVDGLGALRARRRALAEATRQRRWAPPGSQSCIACRQRTGMVVSYPEGHYHPGCYERLRGQGGQPRERIKRGAGAR